MASPPDSTDKRKVDSRNPSGLHQETKNNVAAKPSVKTHSSGQPQRYQPARNCKASAPSVNKNVTQATAAPRTRLVWREKKKPDPSQQPSEQSSAPIQFYVALAGKSDQSRQPVQNIKEFSSPVNKNSRYTTGPPCFVHKPSQSQRWQPVQYSKVSARPANKNHTHTTKSPHQVSLQKFLPPSHPTKPRSKWKDHNHPYHTIKGEISAVIHEACEPVEYSCWICDEDLANPPSARQPGPSNLPEAAVLACGHVFHSKCLELVTPEEQLRDPPCFICVNNLAYLSVYFFLATSCLLHVLLLLQYTK